MEYSQIHKLNISWSLILNKNVDDKVKLLMVYFVLAQTYKHNYAKDIWNWNFGSFLYLKNKMVLFTVYTFSVIFMNE